MNSNHIIIGYPKSFNLHESLRSAASVKLVMAFATKSGWELIREPLLAGKKTVEVLVGLNFGITDPNLLAEWLDIGNQNLLQFKVRVAPRSPVFHPKVMIIHGDGASCAIVGSGNLTGGGQLSNVECGAFLRGQAEIDELENWCGGLKSVPLTKRIIESYRPVHESAINASRLSQAASDELTAALSEEGSNWYKDDFLKELGQFLLTPKGKMSLSDRIQGANKVRTALQMPQLNFTEEGWKEFYGISQFGRIRQAYPEMASSAAALRETFQFLMSKPLDLERFKAVLNRSWRHHVKGLGINQISKVLTVSDRKQWPVLNRRVRTTLANYGYDVGSSAADYLKFAKDMRDLLKEAGDVDFWALDAFCEVKSRELDQ